MTETGRRQSNNYKIQTVFSGNLNQDTLVSLQLNLRIYTIALIDTYEHNVLIIYTFPLTFTANRVKTNVESTCGFKEWVTLGQTPMCII